jgi:phage terminase large subunit-like protein
LRDLTGKHEVGAWADLVLDVYVGGRCDVVVAETNKGGQLVAQNLRAAAAKRGLEVRVLGRDERCFFNSRIVNVREVYARGAKEDRAEPIATAYERGMIVHPFGTRLDSLEDTLTSWEPGTKGDSPGDLDALVHAAVELLALAGSARPNAEPMRGILEVNAALQQAPTPLGLSRILANPGGKI